MMHIYSRDDLFNKYVRGQAAEAFGSNCINDDTYKNILETHQESLYTPNYFIRIALTLLTAIAILFAGLFFGLIFSAWSSNGLAGLFIFMAVITYAILEAMVKQKNYYNAGVDNTLMLFTTVFFVCAFVAISDHPAFVSVMAIIICLWMAIRFTDSFMAGLSYVALLSFVFFLFKEAGGFAKAMTPFALMLVSAITYFVTTKFESEKKLQFYHFCFKCVKLLTMVSLYAACNYFIVQSMSEQHNYYDKPAINQPIPLGWLFWLLTVVIPPAYIVWGIRKKDLLFIRTGLVLSVASILTIRYYYSIVPAEIAMLAGGLLLGAISLWLMKYLKTASHGFIFAGMEPKTKDVKALEALLLIQAAGKKELHQTHTEFGGGDFGGGGAGSTY